MGINCESASQVSSTGSGLLEGVDSGCLGLQSKLLDVLVESSPQHTLLIGQHQEDTVGVMNPVQNDARAITPICAGESVTLERAVPAFSSHTRSNLLTKSIVEFQTCNLMQTNHFFSGLSTKFLAGLRPGTNALCHNLKPYATQAEKLEVQLSETCEKRFVVFDQSGSMKRMIFHPAVVSNFTELVPSNYDKMAGFLAHLHDTSLTAASQLEETISSLFSHEIAEWNAGSLLGNVQLREEMSSMNACLHAKSLTSVGGAEFHPQSLELSEASHKPCGSDDGHENTEDIDALLSSDDDEVCSTGHSLSDLTWSSLPSHGSKDEACSMFRKTYSKKRKGVVTEFCLEEEDDADSATATLGNKFSQKLGSKTCCSELNSLNFGWGSGYGKEELVSCDLSMPDELSSSNGANKQRHCRKVPKRSRKEQIRGTLRLLRGVLPGGESMDTTIVLDEAIQFVKSLQGKVQKLEAAKMRR